ncbi:MAG: hypothetical protein ACIALR_03195 [Blastopirellula sp. JB062]
METPEKNPFASPPIEDQDPVAAPLVDGNRIGRWLALPLISGALNGAGAIGISGFVMLCAYYISEGIFGEYLYFTRGRVALGAMLLQLSLYGGVFGGVSGFLHGCVAYGLRNYLRQRMTITLMGYLFPLLIVSGPAIGMLPYLQGLPLLWKIGAGIVFGLCGLLIGRRMNANIRKYLLSRLEDETNHALA